MGSPGQLANVDDEVIAERDMLRAQVEASRSVELTLERKARELKEQYELSLHDFHKHRETVEEMKLRLEEARRENADLLDKVVRL